MKLARKIKKKSLKEVAGEPLTPALIGKLFNMRYLDYNFSFNSINEIIKAMGDKVACHVTCFLTEDDLKKLEKKMSKPCLIVDTILLDGYIEMYIADQEEIRTRKAFVSDVTKYLQKRVVPCPSCNETDEGVDENFRCNNCGWGRGNEFDYKYFVKTYKKGKAKLKYLCKKGKRVYEELEITVDELSRSSN